jgi:hypothetical protein
VAEALIFGWPFAAASKDSALQSLFMKHALAQFKSLSPECAHHYSDNRHLLLFRSI